MSSGHRNGGDGWTSFVRRTIVHDGGNLSNHKCAVPWKLESISRAEGCNGVGRAQIMCLTCVRASLHCRFPMMGQDEIISLSCCLTDSGLLRVRHNLMIKVGKHLQVHCTRFATMASSGTAYKQWPNAAGVGSARTIHETADD